MRIATLLLVYDRPVHLTKVLNGLRENTERTDALIIRQDGLADTGNKERWNETNTLINEFDYPDKEIQVGDYNVGLATSVITGVTKILAIFDAVIVIEDDCVPAPNFIRYMKQCLDHYKKEKKVYSVGGYAWPIKIEQNKNEDIYFSGRISSWGWGTWKDRWKQFEVDDKIYRRLAFSKEGSACLAQWANDAYNIAIGNVVGSTDSWGIYWALKVIEMNGVCISPYKSLIQNVGNDGTGVHSAPTDKYSVILSDENKGNYVFPDYITIHEDVKRGFNDLYGGYTANSQSDNKESVIVYGLGNYFFKNEKQICERYDIEGIIDNSRKGYYAGKRIMKERELFYCSDSKKKRFLIMIKDPNECVHVCSRLITEYKILSENIALGIILFGEYNDLIRNIEFQSDGSWKIEGCNGNKYHNGTFLSSLTIE